MNKLSTVEDYISDEEFQNWFFAEKRIDPVEKFSLTDEMIRKTFDEAVEVMENLRPNKEQVAENIIEEEWGKVESLLKDSSSAHGAEVNPVKTFKFPVWTRYAAALGFLVLGFAWFQNQHGETQTLASYNTSYQEKKDIMLVDNSSIKLAPNSKVRTAIEDGGKREVWLEGQAFFHVAKQPDSQKPEFTVHVGSLDVIVLGTQFNVLERDNQIIVALKEGSVRLAEGKSNNHLMEPGQVVIYDKQSGSYAMGTRSDSFYYAWLEDKIILDETSLAELSLMLEEKFGVTVQIGHDSLKARKLSGIVPDKDIQVIAAAIRNSLDVNVDFQQDSVVIY